MKLTDFKIGDKFIRPGRRPGVKYLVIGHLYGLFIGPDGQKANIYIDDIMADDWEYYQEPKEERKPETWYRFEWKIKGKKPNSSKGWYKSLEKFILENESKDYEVEPRVYEERIF